MVVTLEGERGSCAQSARNQWRTVAPFAHYLEYLFINLLSHVLWWLILCVDLTQSQGAQIFGQTFRTFLWGRFWMRLTCKSVDWGNQIALFNVVGPLPNQLKGWIAQERLTLPWVRKLFLPLDLNWNISSCWVLSPLACQLELHHPLSWVSSLLICPADLGPCQALQSGELIPCNKSLSTYASSQFCFSAEPYYMCIFNHSTNTQYIELNSGHSDKWVTCTHLKGEYKWINGNGIVGEVQAGLGVTGTLHWDSGAQRTLPRGSDI